MSSLNRKLELLTKLLQRFSVKAAGGALIIVEGIKDKTALEELGILGNVICVKNSSQVTVDLLDGIRSKEIILFVDFDEGGVTLAKEITYYLEGKGIKVDSILWRRIKSIVRRDLKDVEGFPSYLEKLKKRVI